MVLIRANISDDLTKHIDSIIDGELILNRNDAIRQILIEHRDKSNSIK